MNDVRYRDTGTTTAIRIHRPGSADVVELPTGQRGEGYSRVSVEAAGLSLRELSAFTRKRGAVTLPRIPGGYGVGTVVEGAPRRSRVIAFGSRPAGKGRRVLLPSVRECGACRRCLSGEPERCEQPAVPGIDVDGYLSSSVDVPTDLLVEVPMEVTAEAALFAAPLARCKAVLEGMNLAPGDFLLVFGATVEGLLSARLAEIEDLRPILIDTSTARLELATRMGIRRRLNPYACHAPDEVDWLVGEQGVHAALVTGGEQGAFDSAPFLLSPGGTMTALHAVAGTTADLSEMVDRGQSITAPAPVTGDVAQALQDLRAGRIDVRSMISLDLPLESAVDALRLAAENPEHYLQVIARPAVRSTRGR